MVKDYYRLTKPGIVYGNVFTTVAAFLFATRWPAPVLGFLALLAATAFGIALVIASACVFNNYLDRNIDRKMARTKDRALATGAISARSALVYASALGIGGLALLAGFTNLLTAAIALFGFIMYVVVYGAAKRRSEWGTVVGSISGAVPIVVGYTAVTNAIDAPAVILFVILALWQMPHFYAIAMYRLSDYEAAGIPVLPAERGMRTTKRYIAAYIIAYIAAVSSLALLGYAGYCYLALVLAFGIAWLALALRGFAAPDDTAWARRTFLFSLIVLVAFSVTIAVAPLLP